MKSMRIPLTFHKRIHRLFAWIIAINIALGVGCAEEVVPETTSPQTPTDTSSLLVLNSRTDSASECQDPSVAVCEGHGIAQVQQMVTTLAPSAVIWIHPPQGQLGLPDGYTTICSESASFCLALSPESESNDNNMEEASAPQPCPTRNAYAIANVLFDNNAFVEVVAVDAPTDAYAAQNGVTTPALQECRLQIFENLFGQDSQLDPRPSLTKMTLIAGTIGIDPYSDIDSSTTVLDRDQWSSFVGNAQEGLPFVYWSGQLRDGKNIPTDTLAVAQDNPNHSIDHVAMRQSADSFAKANVECFVLDGSSEINNTPQFAQIEPNMLPSQLQHHPFMCSFNAP